MLYEYLLKCRSFLLKWTVKTSFKSSPSEMCGEFIEDRAIPVYEAYLFPLHLYSAEISSGKLYTSSQNISTSQVF